MSISKRFERVFRNLDISQVQFAEIVGTKQSIVSRMISGKVKVSLEAMQILYTRFQINLNWLICGTGKMYLRDLNAPTTINEPNEDYGLYDNYEAWKEALKAKDELIGMQRNEIKRLKEKCGETVS
jgi:transcriptional regulator with XRE-family HTH domain